MRIYRNRAICAPSLQPLRQWVPISECPPRDRCNMHPESNFSPLIFFKNLDVWTCLSRCICNSQSLMHIPGLRFHSHNEQWSDKIWIKILFKWSKRDRARCNDVWVELYKSREPHSLLSFPFLPFLIPHSVRLACMRGRRCVQFWAQNESWRLKAEEERDGLEGGGLATTQRASLGLGELWNINMRCRHFQGLEK